MNRLHDNDLDKLFAEKLEDFRVEPPERAWRKVAAGITVAAPLSVAALTKLVRPFLWTLTTVTTTFFLTVSDSNQEMQEPVEHRITAENPAPENTRESIALLTPKQVQEIKTNISIQNFVAPLTQVIPTFEYAEETNSNPLPEVPTTNLMSESLPPISPIEKLSGTFLKVPELSWKPTLLNEPDLSSDNIMPAWFNMSYEGGYDVFAFNNHLNPNLKTLGLNNGLSVSLHFSDFYLRSGINLLNLSQRNTYNYSVNEYQQVGEYTMVDSISFSPGVDTAGQPILIPHYYTSNHAYFDSVEVQRSIESADKYRFVEIPFAIGFQKNIHRISLYAQTGFTYSFLMNSRLLSDSQFDDLNPEDVLSWQSQAAIPMKNFWSFSLAAGIYYQTNTNLAFGLEPTYRYYLDPVFGSEEQEYKKPVSYGLRVRLLYKL